MSYVILGAAGATGKAITRTLTQQGKTVRVVGRSLARLQSSFQSLGPQVTYCGADLETAQGALEACQGMQTAIVCLGLPYNQFARYPALMQNLVQAAIKANVERMLLITNIYPYGLPQTPAVTEDHPRQPISFKGKMRLEQENILLNAQGKLKALVLRLPDFFGAEAELSYGHSIFAPAIAGKTVNILAPSNTPHQFVYVPDVGPVVAALLDTPAAWGGVLHFAGSGIITVDDFIQQIEQQLGKPIKVARAGKGMLRFIGLFSMVMHELVEMHYLQTSPVLISDDKLVSLIGQPQRTSYQQAIGEVIAQLKAKQS